MKWKVITILASLANGLLCQVPLWWRTHLQPDGLLDIEGLCGLEIDQQAVLREGLDEANVVRQAEVVTNVLQAADSPGDWQWSHVL